jgi:arsenate reductase (thioredoxin)
MDTNNQRLFPDLLKSIDQYLQGNIDETRKVLLGVLIDYMQDRLDQHQQINLNFICTHNSRRSQLAQLWAQTAAYAYGIQANCYSGGVEATAFDKRAVAAVKKAGFRVISTDGENPLYQVSFSESTSPLSMFSKLYDHKDNPGTKFAAIMTCSHADENCPFIAGAEKRLQLLYEDPKEYDGTPQEAAMYHERSRQIATEMFYIFSKIST